MNKVSYCFKKDSDYSTAFGMAIASAFHGNPDACLRVAAFHYLDQVSFANKKHCFDWCINATKGGHPVAMRLVGRMYLEGYHVKRSVSDAKKWFEEASKKGDQESRNWLQFIENDCRPTNNHEFASLKEDMEGVLSADSSVSEWKHVSKRIFRDSLSRSYRGFRIDRPS